jgi:hypothetical protein
MTMTTRYDFSRPGETPSGVGNRLFLLGTSEDGPYMQPTLIRNKTQARSTYGDDSKGTLVKAFDEAYDRNEDISIYLMRITGKSATLDIEGFLSPDQGNPQYGLRLWSVYAGERYNDTQVQIRYDDETQTNIFYIITPTEEIAYELHPYITLGAFVKTLNEDCRLGRHRIMGTTDYPENDFGPVEAWLYREPVSLSGGESGINATRDELWLACDLAYRILQGRQIDIVVPVGMYVDDVHPAYLYGQGVYGSAYYSSTSDYLSLVDTENNNKVVSYHEQLIDFCREQMRLGYMTHGVIGMRPYAVVPENVTNDDSYIKRLGESTSFRDRHGFLEYAQGQWFDKGYYVTVVSQELIFNRGTTSEYYTNGASRYGAILTGHFNSTTNMKLGDDVSLRYELSPETMAELSKLGIVSFRNSVRHGLVVHSGVTASNPETELHNVANVRMVQITLAYLNEATELVYESYYDHDMRRNYLEQLIRDRLAYLAEVGVLTLYDYTIQMREDGVKGAIILSLQTKHTVEAIQVSAEVSRKEG